MICDVFVKDSVNDSVSSKLVYLFGSSTPTFSSMDGFSSPDYLRKDCSKRSRLICQELLPRTSLDTSHILIYFTMHAQYLCFSCFPAFFNCKSTSMSQPILATSPFFAVLDNSFSQRNASDNREEYIPCRP